ncbi:MAG TPA: transglycosylase domain-containing protein [Longimicrobiales bacterium]|nr:transglycosylase domain-containing protein [Longimicrobiales bacterium]
MFKRLLIALPLALLGAAWFYWISIPWPVRLRTHDPDTTAVMRQRIAEARSPGENLQIRHEWVPLDRISPRLQRAVIAAEDGRFRQHGGIDWGALREEFRYEGDDDFSFLDGDDRRALLASFRYYRENRDRIRGRSTITQQVAKNLYYSTQRSTIRKLEEFVVARRLERFLSKDRILEIYLNIVELGPGIFGAEAAARHYFGRSAADLSADQAAALAATLPHPLTSNPRHNPGRMEWRKQLILARMGGAGPVETVPLETATQSVPRDEPAPLGAPVDTAPSEPPAPVRPPPDTTTPDTLPLPRPDTVPPTGAS